jgi:hypothetical protein
MIVAMPTPLDDRDRSLQVQASDEAREDGVKAGTPFVKMP